MNTLESERLILRNWSILDLDDLHEFASNKKVADLAGFKVKNDKEACLKTLNLFISNSDDLLWEADLKESDELIVLAIEMKESHKVIGWIELSNAICLPSAPVFRSPKEIGFVLSKEYWGQGLMPETIKLFVNYLFNKKEIDAVLCSHFIHNSQSEKVIKKCGFKFYLEDEEEKYYYLTKDALDKIPS